MKKILIATSIFFLSFAAQAMELVQLPLPNSDKIVVKFMFRNGSISDPKGMEGLTELTASTVMDGGTGNYSSSKIKELTYPWAARWSASVDKEVTIFTFEFHKDHASKMFPVITGLILNPLFAEEDFKRVKSNQSNYVNQVIKASSDEEFSKKALEDLLFRGTNYQHMISGTSTGLEALTIADVRVHYKSYFSSANLMLGIAGNYTKEYLEQIRTAMNQLPPTHATMAPPALPRSTNGINVEIVTKENALGSAIFTGFALPVNRSKDEFAALMIANSWLGEHRKSYSRLYQKIREARSMNYGDYSYIEWYENGGSNMLPPPGVPRSSNYFSIWIRPVQTAEGLKKQYKELSDIKIGHAHFAIRMAIREMQLLIDNGMTEEDFNLTRDFLRSYMKLYIQTPSRQLGYLMDSKFYNRADYISEMSTLLKKVTLQDVNTVMKKYWQTNNMYISILTDDSEAEPLKESLLKNEISPMSYSDALKATLPQEILKEDEVVSKYKLNIGQVSIIPIEQMFK
jgi:zinc protease